MGIDASLAYQKTNRERFLDSLKELIAIPSISGLEEHKSDWKRCADVLMRQLKEAGLTECRILNADSANEAPIVFASWTEKPDRPTVLMYGHYDVVSVDTREKWDSDPFKPVVKKDECIYGRGASDDKGQLLTSVKAVESMLNAEGALPVNVKFLFEGEEEGDSDALKALLQDQKVVDCLACDVVFISDSHWFAADMPTICGGVRGIVDLDIALKGPKAAVHSGVYGGALANPLNVLAEILGKLKDDDGRITIPGFYDSVVPVSEAVRAGLKRLPFDEEAYKEEAGVKLLRGEKDYTTLERTMCRPCLDIVGLWGGYAGPGPKSAIPTEAGAKMSIRIVANQKPEEVVRLLREYLNKICPEGMDLEVKILSTGAPYLVQEDEPLLKPMRRAMKESFGKEPEMVRVGASIPIVPVLHEKLSVPVLMCDLGLPTDNIHSDNERLPLSQFYKGIETYTRLLHFIGEGD